QALALIVVDENLVTAVRIDFPQLAIHVRTSNQVALAIERHAIGSPGAFQEQRDLAATRIPAVNPIVGLIGEKHVSKSVGGRTFREAKAFGEGHELSVPTHEAERIVDIALR